MLVDSLVLAPPTDSLSIFQGSQHALQHKAEYDRYQCRNLVLSVSPKEMMSEVGVFALALLLRTLQFLIVRTLYCYFCTDLREVHLPRRCRCP